MNVYFILMNVYFVLSRNEFKRYLCWLIDEDEKEERVKDNLRVIFWVIVLVIIISDSKNFWVGRWGVDVEVVFELEF